MHLLDTNAPIVLSYIHQSEREGEPVSQRSRIELHLNSRFFGVDAAQYGITLPFFGLCSE